MSKKKKKYLFKITVDGPNDSLNQDVLKIITQSYVQIHGLGIYETTKETDNERINTVIMSPKHDAMHFMLSLSYKRSSGALIVLENKHKDKEQNYRERVIKNAGDIPTRIIHIPDGIDHEELKKLIGKYLDELIDEIIEIKIGGTS